MDVNEMLSGATEGFSVAALLNLPSILRVLFTIVVGMIAMKVIMGIVDRTLSKSKSFNSTLSKYIRSVIHVVLWLILMVLAAGVGILAVVRIRKER